MDFDWKKLVATVAPTLATALGGPVAGLAVKTIADGLGVAPTIEAVSQAITNATPEQLATLKKIDADFSVQMKQLDIDVLKIEQESRASAQDREIKTGDHATPRLLAGFAVACFVGLVFSVLHGVSVDQGMKDTFLILVGAAIAVFKDVYGYYFGSSAGSRDKDKLLNSK